MVRTAIASHRGGAGTWPENSITAFRKTASLDLEFVEFDLHPSRDGELVVHHDPVLERTTSGTGAVRDLDWADLARLTVNGSDGEPIPRLADVVAIFADTPIRLRVEIKPDPARRPYPGFEAQVADALAGHGVLENATVSSFAIDILDRFRRHGTAENLVWLIHTRVLASLGGIAPLAAVAREHGVSELAIRADDLDADRMAEGRDAGVAIGAFHANTEAQITKVLDLGVTAFTSDYPECAIALRAARG